MRKKPCLVSKLHMFWKSANVRQERVFRYYEIFRMMMHLKCPIVNMSSASAENVETYVRNRISEGHDFVLYKPELQFQTQKIWRSQHAYEIEGTLQMYTIHNFERSAKNFIKLLYEGVEHLRDFRGNEPHRIYVCVHWSAVEIWMGKFGLVSISGSGTVHPNAGCISVPSRENCHTSGFVDINLNAHSTAEEAIKSYEISRVLTE